MYLEIYRIKGVSIIFRNVCLELYITSSVWQRDHEGIPIFTSFSITIDMMYIDKSSVLPGVMYLNLIYKIQYDTFRTET